MWSNVSGSFQFRRRRSVPFFSFVSYKCELPEHFHFAHPIGSILGNAVYHDFLVISQGVTVNTGYNGEDGKPELGKGLFLSANASIIGGAETKIGSYVSIGVNALVFRTSVPDHSVVKSMDGCNCVIEPRKHNDCRAQTHFNIRF